ncbi:MAG: [Fe-S]-binding protein, partial [Candidatus Brocadiaceae bacterium]|nr:[Fe-S]-binding protein [Candidatus Brocadiaceae bacterium]
VQAGPALDGDVNYPVLAEEAGLGAIGKHGLLINPKFGPSLRIATLYVDVENLPVNGVNKHLWIKEFSRKCNNCVRKCPGSAIYKETKIFVDRSEQHIDYKKCAVPFSNQYNCTVCVKECSFYKNDYSKIKSRFQRKN